jgi:hypothetical protein
VKRNQRVSEDTSKEKYPGFKVDWILRVGGKEEGGSLRFLVTLGVLGSPEYSLDPEQTYI